MSKARPRTDRLVSRSSAVAAVMASLQKVERHSDNRNGVATIGCDGRHRQPLPAGNFLWMRGGLARGPGVRSAGSVSASVREVPMAAIESSPFSLTEEQVSIREAIDKLCK